MAEAYAYLRVSGQAQVDGDGFERQLVAIEEYAHKNKYKIVGIFKDGAISGSKCEEDRPAFREMIAEILRNNVSTVIIESLDRLAREYMTQEQLMIYLVSKDIDLISTNTGENVTEAIQANPMRKAMVQIQGIFSELDKSLLVTKLRKARERVRKDRGKCEGAKRYGENSDEEQAIVRKIRAMRRTKRGGHKGLTYSEIADRLNAKGIKTKRGKQWGPSQIYRILHSKK